MFCDAVKQNKIDIFFGCRDFDFKSVDKLSEFAGRNAETQVI